MFSPNHQGGLIIIISFIVAMMLTIIPMPLWAVHFRPEWVVLTFVYWSLALPHRISVGTAWVIGILMDILLGGLLGQHALALAIVAFIVVKFHQQIRVFPAWQQALSVFVIVMTNQIILQWIKGITGQHISLPGYWGPAITSALLWPWVYTILRSLRRSFRVS